MNFLQKNKNFTFGFFATAILTFWAIYYFGFGEAANHANKLPERLRDYTFHVWENYTVGQHGYLVFYSLKDFQERIAYSNHSTAYLLCMYLIYKIELLIPIFSMRVMAAFLNMFLLVSILFYIITKLAKNHICFSKSILILLALVFMISMPAYWISSARFNVDNPYPLILSLNALAAFFIWQDKGKGKRVFIAILIFALFSPVSAAVLGIALFLYAFQRNGLNLDLIKLAFLTLVFGCVFYFQAPMVSKILGFSASNSGWLFRAGLDGDTRYFINIIESILSPISPRPLHIILIPILLVILQATYFKSQLLASKTQVSGGLIISDCYNKNIFYYLLFSQYIISCLLWPQAITIHPYLYDFLLLAPICVLIILNFLSFPITSFYPFWLIVLLFCISFNFQQIAMAKCATCNYPAWSIKK